MTSAAAAARPATPNAALLADAAPVNVAYGATLECMLADGVTLEIGFTYPVPVYEATETVPVAPAGVL